MVDNKMLNEVKEAQRVVYFLSTELRREVVDDVDPNANPTSQEVRVQRLITEAAEQIEAATVALGKAFWTLRSVVPKPNWENQG